MKGRAVYVERVALHRVRGIARGEGFSLDGLSEGVNVIHGPNGCGKTTTALAIQALLWPGRTGLDRPSLDGRLSLDAEEWTVSLDAGQATCSRDGSEAGLPSLGPPEHRKRYLLALDELIAGDDADFARRVGELALGGDVRKAAERLGGKARPSLARSAVEAFRDAERRVREAQGRLEEVNADERRLEQLRAERAEAVEAETEARLLDAAIRCAEEGAKVDEARARLEAMDARIGRLSGDERERLDEIDDRRRQCDEALARERERLAEADAALRRVDLPEIEDPDGLMRDLRASCRRLEQIVPEIDRLTDRLRAAEARESAARRRLGKEADERCIEALDAVEDVRLSDLAREAHRLAGEEEALARQAEWLEAPDPPEIRDMQAEGLLEGALALANWLSAAGQDDRRASSHGLPWWPAPVLGVLAGVAVAAAWGRWPLAALAAMAAMGAWWVVERIAQAVGRPPAGADPREVLARQYEQTQLPCPDAWTPHAVSRAAARLHRLSAMRSIADERARRAGELARRREEHSGRREALDARRREVCESLGIDVGFSVEWLPALVEAIVQWQGARDERSAVKAQRDGLVDERDRLLADARRRTASSGVGEPDTPHRLREATDELQRRLAARKEAMGERQAATRRITETIEPERASLADRRRSLLAAVGLEAGEEERLADWLDRLEAYRAARRDLEDASAVWEHLRKRLADRPELLQAPGAELIERHSAAQRLAERRDELSGRIAAIEQAVEHAKRGHDLGDALEARDEALAGLAEARADAERQVVGHVLAEWVRTTALERSRPDVYRQAEAIVARITRGRLRLSLDDASDAPRIVVRCGDGPARGVEGLSVGERVQVLLAVRLALMELDEPARLPLLLDEALGTSDDQRAGAIIDGVIEVARSGRQVFYFTAQHDEAGKWDAKLREAGVAHRLIDLGKLRHLSAAGARPLEITTVPGAEVPSPDGMTPAQYGRELGVTRIDPWRRSADEVHLWHVVDDLSVLHGLLRRGIRTWGQLRQLVSVGGEDLVDAEALERARAAARAIEAACAAWRVGRGQPIDRAVLEDSDAVSERFVDDLAELARELGGDARALVEALERREDPRTKGFFQRKTDELREYLIEGEYLPTREALGREAVRLEAMGAAAGALRGGLLDQRWVDEMVASLFAQER